MQAEADRIATDAGEYAYVSTLQFPDFIDNVCESDAKEKLDPARDLPIATPSDLLEYIFEARDLNLHVELERKECETSRDWMERIERMEREYRKTAVRIYDISRKLGLTNSDTLAMAKALNITAAKVPSSILDQASAIHLERELIKDHPEAGKRTKAF